MKKSESEQLSQSAKAFGKIKHMIQNIEIGEEKRLKGREKKQDRPVHLEKDIQEYEAGRIHYIKCDKDFVTSVQLQRHLHKYHMYKFPFRCEDCGRGLSTKHGYEMHMARHEEGEKK